MLFMLTQLGIIQSKDALQYHGDPLFSKCGRSLY